MTSAFPAAAGRGRPAGAGRPVAPGRHAPCVASGGLVLAGAAPCPVTADPENSGEPDGGTQVRCRDRRSGTAACVSLGRHYAGGDLTSVEVFGTRDDFYSGLPQSRERGARATRTVAPLGERRPRLRARLTLWRGDG